MRTAGKLLETMVFGLDLQGTLTNLAVVTVRTTFIVGFENELGANFMIYI